MSSRIELGLQLDIVSCAECRLSNRMLTYGKSKNAAWFLSGNGEDKLQIHISDQNQLIKIDVITKAGYRTRLLTRRHDEAQNLEMRATKLCT